VDRTSRLRRLGRPLTIVSAGAAVAVTGAAAAGRLTGGYIDPWKARVAAAGVRLKAARVGDIDFSYAEGPDGDLRGA
jgi:hypothetical protein